MPVNFPQSFPRLVGGAAVCLALILPVRFAAAAEKMITFDAPASVTCIGKCADGEALMLAVQRAGVEPKYEEAFDVKDLEDTKTLFLTITAEANVNVKDEIARAGRLLDQAAKDDVQVVVVQMGSKRDPATQELINAIVPRSNVIITIPDVDPDGLLQKIADGNGIPLRMAKSKSFLPELIKAAFGSGT